MGVWSLAGIVAGLAGLATSYFVAMVLAIRESPVVAVAELVIRLTPGGLPRPRSSASARPTSRCWSPGSWCSCWPASPGPAACPTYLVGAGAGLRRSRRRRGRRRLAGPARRGSDVLPVVVGFVTWVVVLSLLTDPLGPPAASERAPAGGARRATRPSRRGVPGPRRGDGRRLGRRSPGSAGSSARGRRKVEETRRLLRLDGRHPAGGARRGAASGVDGRVAVDDAGRRLLPDRHRHRGARHRAERSGRCASTAWSTGARRSPTTTCWRRELTEAWVTLNCVSNPVGGDLIGNAWWSGVRIADLLAEAGVRRGADAVLQTSDDGWTCGTPLGGADRRPQRDAGRGDERRAAADRARLPGAHDRARPLRLRLGDQVARRPRGDPVRRGRGLLDRARLGRAGPGQDRPPASTCPAPAPRSPPARSRVGGVAWAQHTGIAAVEFSVDGGDWQAAELAPPAPTTPGCSGRPTSLSRRATTCCGSGPSTRPAWCRPGRGAGPPRRGDRLARGRIQRRVTTLGVRQGFQLVIGPGTASSSAGRAVAGAVRGGGDARLAIARCCVRLAASTVPVAGRR